MDNKVKKGAKIYFIRSLIAPILMGMLFFVFSGYVEQPRAWFYYTMFFLLSLGLNGYLYFRNPELMYHRNSIKSDAKGWDKVIMPAAVLTAFHLQSITMGLDIRFGGPNLDHVFFILGTIFYLISFVISSWAMIENEHFEANVRIQKERHHHVVSTGPYRFIRHPGYLAFVIGTIGVPFIIGAKLGLINAFVGILLILVRTYKEDKTLRNELDGYVDYSARVKYRIVPGIW